MIKKIQAVSILINMIIAIFAFSFFIGLENVSAAVKGEVNINDGTIWDGDQYVTFNSPYGKQIYSDTHDKADPTKLSMYDNIFNAKKQPSTAVIPPRSTGGTGALGTASSAASLIKLKGGSGNGVTLDAGKIGTTDLAGQQFSPGTYKVGDEVWKIEEKSFSSGYNVAKYDSNGNLIATDVATKDAGFDPQTFSIGNAAAGAGAATKANQAWLASKLPIGSPISAIVSAVQWAAIAFIAGQLIGRIAGFSEKQTNALSFSMAAGFGVYEGLASWGTTSTMLGGFLPIIGGALAGGIVLLALWKTESKQIVTFECLSWQAPLKGENCEKCNSDLYPCSEYRCKSLGQGCELINKGTNEEKCVWKRNDDVSSPIIKADEKSLTKDHKYTPNNAIRPPDTGVKVINNLATDGCLKAFSEISFGVILNEPAECRVDYNRTAKFDQMQYFMGESNTLKYNHTQKLRLPNPSITEPELKIGGDYNFYVRCRDANGNENNDLFVFSFCVENGPDLNAPIVEDTSIRNNMPVQYGLNETYLEVYVNEPAECKWSKTDIVYEQMERNMSCASNVYEMNNKMLYKCSTTLNGLENKKDNEFFFRCRDQPWLGESNDRITNKQSYKFVLKGSSNNLLITSIKPNQTISGAGTSAATYLEIRTEFGSNNGDAYCYYSTTEEEKDYILFKDTGTNIHKQRLDLTAGSYKYYIQCVDLGGNAARNYTSFNVEIDKSFPSVVRVYNEAGKLKVVTDEKSTCSYSTNKERNCQFAIAEGINMPNGNTTLHFAEWNPDLTYYIKCIDENGNEPDVQNCNIIVKPSKQ